MVNSSEQLVRRKEINAGWQIKESHFFPAGKAKKLLATVSTWALLQPNVTLALLPYIKKKNGRG